MSKATAQAYWEEKKKIKSFFKKQHSSAKLKLKQFLQKDFPVLYTRRL